MWCFLIKVYVFHSSQCESLGRKSTKHASCMFWAVSMTQSVSRASDTGTPSVAPEALEHADSRKEVEHADSSKEVEQQYVVDNEDLLDKKVKAKVRSLLWYIVVIPFVLSFSLWLLGTYASKEYMPSSLDVHLWRNFSTHVVQSVQAMDAKYPHNVLLLLMGIQAIQVLFCFPLLHVTKMMYGYFFRSLQGGLIACAWELFLVSLFVVVATQNIPIRPPAVDLAGFLQYVDSLRVRRLLVPFLVALHISSVPLVTSTCLVLFNVVSRCEFLISHAIATVCMTFKDTWLGDFLASSDGNASNIAIAATLLSASALLPTVVTVMLMGLVSAASVSKSAKSTEYKSFTRV
jgi:hypothetical protein